jgi:hypothetical protein
MSEQISQRISSSSRDGGSAHTRVPLRRPTRTVVVALVAGLAAAGLAAAATGTFSVGSIVPAGEPAGAPDYRTSVDQRVLAEGKSPVAGSWWITTYESERMLDTRGEEMQPAGLSCLSLVLTDPPKGVPLRSRWYCGEHGTGGFDAKGVPVSDAAGRSEVILFGRAPEAASMVELVADDGTRIRSRVHQGPPDYRGDVWAAVASPRLGDRHPRVDWIDPSGRRGGANLDVSREFEARLTPAPAG